MDTKAEYRKQVNEMGKKEFTFLKMQEYGFWPSNLPTPYAFVICPSWSITISVLSEGTKPCWLYFVENINSFLWVYLTVILSNVSLLYFCTSLTISVTS